MLRKLLRSTSFRVAGMLGSAFVAALVIAGSVELWLVGRDLDASTDSAIAGTADIIARSYAENDVSDLSDTVSSHARAYPKLNRVFLLSGPDGAYLAGNITKAAVSEGWSTVSPQAVGLPGGDMEYRVLARKIDGYTLLVGVGSSEEGAIEHLVTTSLATAAGIFILLALAAGGPIALRAQKRLDQVVGTMTLVSHGDLSARIPVDHLNDDIRDLSIQINRALDRLSALVEGMRQVSVDIAHDLKTPLNRLAITIENAIAATTKGEAVGELLLQAQAESDQINRTFDALLRVAQLESGTRRKRLVATAFGPIMEAIADAYASVAEEAGQLLRVETARDLPPVLGDRDLLLQLLSNLIENAIRHGAHATLIEVKAVRDGAQLSLTVSDNGPGIPAGEREKVFRRFYRLEKSRTSSGTGLGLSLVKAIADLHDARIELLDNDPGLIAHLTFPAAQIARTGH